MFEDLEKFLSDNHKSGKQGKNNDTRDRIIKALRGEFGEGKDIEVVGDGKISLSEVAEFGGLSSPDASVSSRLLSKDVFKRKIQGLADSLLAIASSAKVKPSCTDSKGNKIKIGDKLKTPNGSFKTVLSLGVGFVNLSHTDDQTQDDGVWFQHEIFTFNFIKE